MPFTNPQQVLDNWAFFLEGLVELNNPQGARGDVHSEAFLKIALTIVDKGLDFGLVAMLTSVNGKPLGFGMAYDNTEPFCQRSAIVYAVYSNKKCPSTTKELLYHAEIWATNNGFKNLHACSRRFSGAGFRLFESIWGFRRVCIVFNKDL